jgi:metallophosphoesterase (TIGR00282 family)
MKILFLGDVVGSDARLKICQILPDYRHLNAIDFIIVNGENAAGGFGITHKICQEFYNAGVDAITMGNHTWDNKEIFGFIDNDKRLVRPANYPKGTAGRGSSMLQDKQGRNILVINIMGRVFMHPTLGCPFKTLDRELELPELGRICDAIIVDIHAEATSEKQALGHYADGRVSLVVGTHTHVPTADERILPKGTGYHTDSGMCGVYDSVVGMKKNEPINRFITKLNGGRFEPAIGDATLCGTLIETDNITGLCQSINRVSI